MNKFIFKSSKGLLKNSSITLGGLGKQLEYIQLELRHQRSEHKDITLMLNKLLIDKHLQSQVDDYFTEDRQHTEDSADLD